MDRSRRMSKRVATPGKSSAGVPKSVTKKARAKSPMARHSMSVSAVNVNVLERESWVGKRVGKFFPGHGNFVGTISYYAPRTDTYMIVYEDGDEEVLTYDGMAEIVSGQYSSPPKQVTSPLTSARSVYNPPTGATKPEKTFGGDESVMSPPQQSTGPLSNEFTRLASVTTMERKWIVSPNIAEFFCFLTSPAYAYPCSLWWTHTGTMTQAMHLALLSCLLTATFSTLYHMTLTKFTSSLDAGVAVVTFWVISLLLMKVTEFQTHLAVVFVLAAIYTYSWQKTAKISIVLTLLVVPTSMWTLCNNGETWAAMSFAAGVVCFILDRQHFYPLHSAWHLLVSYTCYRSCVLALRFQA